MPSRELARRFAALICCKVLHESGELDEYLQPIGKEAFRASEPEYNNFELSKEDAEIIYSDTEARPGTTRRRQYYFKRVNITYSTAMDRKKRISEEILFNFRLRLCFLTVGQL